MTKKLAKTLPMAEVLWKDAHGGDSGWNSQSDTVKATHGAKTMVTVGHVLQHDEVGITVALNFDVTGPAVSSYIFIPAECVVAVNRLVPAK